MRCWGRAAAVALVAGTMCVPLGASAQLRSVSFVTPALAEFSDAEVADLSLMATDANISLEEAAAQYGWQDDFAVAATELEDQFPDTYAGGEIMSTTPPSVQVRFKGKVPVAASAVFRNLPGSVKVDLTGGEAMSQAEVGLLVASVHAQMTAQYDSAGMSSEYDRRTGKVIVSVVPKDAAAATNGVASALQEEAAAAGMPPVEIRVYQGAPGGPDARNGGGWLETLGTSTGDPACTAGFNVINGSGTTSGVATAGHCGNSLSHENYSGQAEYAVSHVNQHVGTYGDFQWGTTTDHEYDDFYYDSTHTARDVSALASPLVNQRLCRFGSTTGARCAEVEANGICYNLPQGQACNLTRMKNRLAAVGDSGGPWYYGNTAYGFHSGGAPTVFGERDAFSKATLIDDALGVWVRK